MQDYVASANVSGRRVMASPGSGSNANRHPRKKYVADYMHASSSTDHPVVNLTRASIASSGNQNRNSLTGNINPMIMKHLSATHGKPGASGNQHANYN